MKTPNFIDTVMSWQFFSPKIKQVLSSRKHKVGRADIIKIIVPAFNAYYEIINHFKLQLEGVLFESTHSRTLTVSSSSRASVSPVVLLKLLVLEEEREMLGLPPLHSFSLINGLLRKRNTFNIRKASDWFEELKVSVPLFVGADLRWAGIWWCLWPHFLGRGADLCRFLVAAGKITH